jgi:hypothetical protein
MLGTAVNVQAMVFGNLGETSGTGVGFTRNPATGVKEFYGEFLMNAQGEDVVAGIRTPVHISELEKIQPDVYNQLREITTRLEKHYRDLQDFEFTIQDGRLYMLQTRNGKRTGRAAVRVAIQMVEEGLITKEEAIFRVEPNQLYDFLVPRLDEKGVNIEVLATGLPASPGAATGKIVFTAAEAEIQGGSAGAVILVREETSPEDIRGMDAARGIVTARGGMTSHAAGLAGRGRGTDCLHRRRSGGEIQQGQDGQPDPGAQRDYAGRHRRNGSGFRHSDFARRHDQPRGGGHARHGQVLRCRRRRHSRGREGARDSCCRKDAEGGRLDFARRHHRPRHQRPAEDCCRLARRSRAVEDHGLGRTLPQDGGSRQRRHPA